MRILTLLTLFLGTQAAAESQVFTTDQVTRKSSIVALNETLHKFLKSEPKYESAGFMRIRRAFFYKEYMCQGEMVYLISDLFVRYWHDGLVTDGLNGGGTHGYAIYFVFRKPGTQSFEVRSHIYRALDVGDVHMLGDPNKYPCGFAQVQQAEDPQYTSDTDGLSYFDLAKGQFLHKNEIKQIIKP